MAISGSIRHTVVGSEHKLCRDPCLPDPVFASTQRHGDFELPHNSKTKVFNLDDVHTTSNVLNTPLQLLLSIGT